MNTTLAIWKAFGIPEPVLEFKFCADRRWRADYAFIPQKVLVEVEGGVFTRGRHTRGVGFAADMEKYNAAASLGWRLLRFQPKELSATATINTIKVTLGL